MAESKKYILFKLHEQIFAVNVQQIISIERMQTITEVPRTSEFIKGVTKLRGETTPVIDLRERLLLNKLEETDNTRILVVHVNEMQIGMVVDAATEVIDIEEEMIEEPPKLVGKVRNTFLKGVAKVDERLLLILQLEQIINFEETNELKEVLEEEN
ncbi:chemotaxis protein CheW [Oceanobacillus sp. 1P07AA]|uniref:chemotaxis protein CheW n=1 Tax=Oceanobacillus sp. 1P07AA TaxID=3132293 RepID=UPI0039A787CE